MATITPSTHTMHLPLTLSANPLLLPALATALGCLLPPACHTWLGIATAATITLLAWIVTRLLTPNPSQAYLFRHIHWLWICPLFCILGLTASYCATPPAYTQISDQHSPLIRCTVDDISHTSDGDRLSLTALAFTDSTATRNTPCAPFRILAHTRTSTLLPGHEIVIPSRLDSLTPSANTANPRLSQSITGTGTIASTTLHDGQYAVTGRHNSIRHTATSLRNRISRLISASSLKPSTASFLQAILLGDKTSIDKVSRHDFAASGTAHILAVSGMHTGIIAAILLLITMPLTLLTGRKIRYLTVLLGLWAFAFVTGLATPVLRASIMLSFILIAAMSGRRNSPLNSLCAAAVIIMLFDPSCLRDPGFLLSFVTTAAIITTAHTFQNPTKRQLHPLRHKILTIGASSLIAFAASWTIALAYFGHVPLLFLPANLILLPLMPLIFILSAIHIFLLALGADLALTASLLDSATDIFTHVTHSIASVKGAYIHLSPDTISPWLYTIGLALAVIWLHSRKKWILACSAILLTASSVAILLLPENIPADRIIIRKSLLSDAITRCTGGDEQIINLPQSRRLSIITGKTSVVWDDSPDTTSHPQSPDKCHILILGKNSSADLRHILSRYSPKMIAVLATVDEETATQWHRQAARRNLPFLHIAHSGAVHVLTDSLRLPDYPEISIR